MSTSTNSTASKVVIGCLISILCTGAAAYTAFGLDASKQIAVLQANQSNTSAVVAQLVENNKKQTETNEKLTVLVIDAQARIKVLERQQEINARR